MIYSYDKAAQIPLMDLYDTQMILASVNAARDMYEKGLQQMKDFRKDYGDLMFSNDSYQNWYNNEFDINKFVDGLYKQGIDPVRSQEGRAMLSQYINSRNYGELAKRRAWDANMQAYKKSIADNIRKYDPEFETWRIGGDINNWGDRPFTQSSIVPYENLQEMTLPSFSTIKPHLLTTKEAIKKLGEDYNPRNTYKGITREDMEQVMGEWMPGVRNDVLFQYQRELAKRDLIREGYDNPSEDQIDNKLVQNAITSNAGIMTPLEEKADEWEMLRQEHQYAIALENQRAANDAAIASIKAGNNTDSDGNYLHLLSNQAASSKIGFELQLLHGKEDQLERINNIEDPEQRAQALNQLRSNIYTEFFTNPKYGPDGKKNIVETILSMEDNVGNTNSTHTINSILDNMATQGNAGMNADYLLRNYGFEPNGDGDYERLAGGEKVVTPHELLGNIIKYETGDDQLSVNIPGVGLTPISVNTSGLKQRLVEKLETIAGGYEAQGWWDISDREPGNVAASTRKVRPNAGAKNIIIAPDNNGKQYIWVKVTSKSNSMFQGDHDGYWVRTMEIGNDNLPVTDAGANIYAAGVQERKQYGNAGVSQEWINQR